jgi:membrane protein
MAMKELQRRLDAFQQSHAWLAFPFGVAKKFGEDRGGQLAALVAYYAFFGIFPLLLVLVTVLGILLKNNPDLQHRILNSALAQFPIIGDQLKAGKLNRAGLGLIIGLVGTFIGARGMAAAMQDAANAVWGVPYAHRPKFPMNFLRNLGVLIVVGGGLVGTTVLTGYATSIAGHGLVSRVIGIIVSTILNIGVFFLAFRLATAKSVESRCLVPGAVLAAIGWQVLQLLGNYLVQRQIAQASAVYGFFAIVIGLLTWLYLAALVTVYALEIDVVRARRLWPRSLVPEPPLTEADQEALSQYARTEQRLEDQKIEVQLPQSPDTGAKSDGARDDRYMRRR